MYSVNLVEAIAEYPGDKHESDLRKDWHPFYQEPQLVYVLSRQLDCQRASASWQRPAFGCSSSSEMPTPPYSAPQYVQFFSTREEFLQKRQALLLSRLTIIEHLKFRYPIWLV